MRAKDETRRLVQRVDRNEDRGASIKRVELVSEFVSEFVSE